MCSRARNLPGGKHLYEDEKEGTRTSKPTQDTLTAAFHVATL